MIKAFGIKIDTYTVQEFVEHIIADIETGKRAVQVTGINIEQIALIKKCKEFKDYCNTSDYTNIDGTSVSVFLKLLGHKEAKRALCADIFYGLLEYADKKGKSIYLLGASPDVIPLVANNLSEKYSNINIVGFHDGYYKNEKEIIEEIKSAKPTFLFLGMPSPMKERFISLYKQELDASVCFGVGGMFDIIAGKAERAPQFWQKIGLEWLYRITQNPKGHTKRVYKALLPSLSVFFREMIKKDNNS